MEREGLPAALITTLTSVAQNVGANRIVTGAGIPHVVGNPDLDPVKEKEFRRSLVERGLRALATPLESQQVF